jgi:hypothetical protein
VESSTVKSSNVQNSTVESCTVESSTVQSSTGACRNAAKVLPVGLAGSASAVPRTRHVGKRIFCISLFTMIVSGVLDRSTVRYFYKGPKTVLKKPTAYSVINIFYKRCLYKHYLKLK